MRILVFEYISGGGSLDKPLPKSLSVEGDQMLQALVKDLTKISGIDVLITRDERLPSLSLPIQELRLSPSDRVDDILNDLFTQVDAVWPIAPETQGILEKVSQHVLDAGKILLNSPPSAVSIAASKKRTTKRLSIRGIPVVPIYSELDEYVKWSGEWIAKPDDGVGCEGIQIFDTFSDALRKAPQKIYQPYLPGSDMSLSMICSNGVAQLLSVNRQQIVQTGDSLLLNHCVCNAVTEGLQTYHDLANEITQAIPDLWGYVGVDLLVNGKDIKVLEINPRLTSSYAGLAETLNINPAEKVLKLQACNHEQVSNIPIMDRYYGV